MQTQTTFSQKHRTPIKQDFFAHLKVSTGSFLRESLEVFTPKVLVI